MTASIEPSGVFEIKAARRAQDLLDTRLSGDRADACGSDIHGWITGGERCLALVSKLPTTITSVRRAADPATSRRLDTLAGALEELREELAKLVDEQIAAVWMSLPESDRVARLRGLLALFEEAFKDVDARAGLAPASRKALAQRSRLRLELEARVAIDPSSARKAGYDPTRHDRGFYRRRT